MSKTVIERFARHRAPSAVHTLGPARQRSEERRRQQCSARHYDSWRSVTHIALMAWTENLRSGPALRTTSAAHSPMNSAILQGSRISRALAGGTQRAFQVDGVGQSASTSPSWQAKCPATSAGSAIRLIGCRPIPRRKCRNTKGLPPRQSKKAQIPEYRP